jgi:RNA polymerase sigma-70 factor (ECF subfamily)
MLFGSAGLTDEAVQAAVGGSRADLEHVLSAVEPQVPLMVAARLSPTGSRWDAIDDVTQEVLLALTTALPRLENPTVNGLRALLSGIVARRVARLLERGICGSGLQPVARSLDSTATSLSSAGALWDLLAGSDTSPRSAAERAELIERLIAALGGLKREYREIITLAFFDQLPMAQIAGRLDSSRAGASMLLVRAVATLRRNVTGSSKAGLSHDAVV